MHTFRRSQAVSTLSLAVLTAALAAPVSLARQEEPEEKPAAEAAQEAGRPAPGRVPAGTKTRPPRTGRFVGDHWTPYEPPSAESFPEGSTIHVIVPGDTLWDLSGSYLQDPYLWPQIWDVNQYITDSHWIYPGDPVLIPVMPTVIGEGGPPVPSDDEGVEPLLPAGPPAEAPETAAAPAPQLLPPAGPMLVPIADESDVECASYIVDRYEPPALAIHEREDPSRTVLGPGDIVFLNQGMSSNLVPGAEYTILTYEGVVPHPIFMEDVGDSVRPVGRLRVLAVQPKSATAQIVQACDAVEKGMRLVPYEEIPVPLATPGEFRRYGVQLDVKNAGYIVDSSPDKAAMGAGDIINVDLGADQGLQPGDVLTVFREFGGEIRFASTDSYIDNQQARAEKHRIEGTLDPTDYPQAILGQILILRTQKNTATAKVITSTKEMALGDRVALR
ncbi:MAG TPA: LysM peptidoglycan-binding domain-containing protein [Candidatus Polarisedimenticolia bacterium]|nr:LysM peptidoglycan-binding domain-containing protein [Candidatus Polarisedimenticolia bacterium]